MSIGLTGLNGLIGSVGEGVESVGDSIRYTPNWGATFSSYIGTLPYVS